MKKAILTVAALLVSASMVFAFAGCSKDNTNNEEPSSEAVVEEVSAEAVSA